VFSSLTASVFTVVFVATGGWALYRLAIRGSDSGVDHPTELAHLLMSLAMVAMVWDWSGGPDSASGIVQVVVFGLFSLWFLPGTLRGSLPSGLHLVSTAAMVWMVVAMPYLMGMAKGSAITVLTVLFAVLLAAAAGLWTERAVSGGAPAQIALDEPVTWEHGTWEHGTGEHGTGEHGTGEPGTGRTAVRVAERVVVRRRVTTRLDASCHALMNLGMGAVLVAML
jgi:Domain of unknown function (DUF5134)